MDATAHLTAFRGLGIRRKRRAPPCQSSPSPSRYLMLMTIDTGPARCSNRVTALELRQDGELGGAQPDGCQGQRGASKTSFLEKGAYGYAPMSMWTRH